MSDYKLYSLPYHANLIQQYQNLRALPGFALLESREHRRGRYDIVSAYPYQGMTLNRGDNVTAFLSEMKEQMLHYPSMLNLPFQGGVIGFFSYDLAMCLMGIENQVPPAIAGQIPLAQVGFYDWAIISDHQTQQVTLYAGHHPATLQIVDEILACWHEQDAVNYVAQVGESFRPLIHQANYNQAFDMIKQVLQQGRCYQVNYTQPFNTRFQGDSWALYTKIGQANPVPFAAYLSLDEGELLSFSPERFLMMENGHLLASPIKGTAKRSPDPQQDEMLRRELANSAKNRAENVMIVDMMRNDLSKIAKPGSVHVSSLCELQSFEAVHHLVSNVHAQCLDYLHPLEAFISCFPGASITGAPKREAMKVISELEQYTRGAYCGSMGYFSRHGRFDMNIAIRTILAKDNQLSLSAGGALVIDSECEDEYQECFIKIEAINKGLS